MKLSKNKAVSSTSLKRTVKPRMISYGNDPIIGWLQIWQTIPGAFWLQHFREYAEGDKTMTLCIPIKYMDHAPYEKDFLPTYLRIPRTEKPVELGNCIKVLTYREDIQRLSEEELKRFTEFYTDYFCPITCELAEQSKNVRSL